MQFLGKKEGLCILWKKKRTFLHVKAYRKAAGKQYSC